MSENKIPEVIYVLNHDLHSMHFIGGLSMVDASSVEDCIPKYTSTEYIIKSKYDSEIQTLKDRIKELESECNKLFEQSAYQGVDLYDRDMELSVYKNILKAIQISDYEQDFEDLLDGCRLNGEVEVAEKPNGDKQNEDCGIFKDIHVDQWSVGDSGDSFAGYIYAKVNNKWLKIPYSC